MNDGTMITTDFETEYRRLQKEYNKAYERIKCLEEMNNSTTVEKERLKDSLHSLEQKHKALLSGTERVNELQKKYDELKEENSSLNAELRVKMARIETFSFCIEHIFGK